MSQAAFLDDVIDFLQAGDVDEISASDLADGWAMHPSTVRTWLHEGWQLGALDRRRHGRNYLYRLSDNLPATRTSPEPQASQRFLTHQTTPV